jgi:hypothetical protein
LPSAWVVAGSGTSAAERPEITERPGLAGAAAVARRPVLGAGTVLRTRPVLGIRTVVRARTTLVAMGYVVLPPLVVAA